MEVDRAGRHDTSARVDLAPRRTLDASADERDFAMLYGQVGPNDGRPLPSTRVPPRITRSYIVLRYLRAHSRLIMTATMRAGRVP
jgi:hypothetical protein